MKNLIFILLLLIVLVPNGAFSNDCKRPEDCREGCLSDSGEFLCLPAEKIKFVDGEKNCRRPIGGLACGCKDRKCIYALPQVFSENLQNNKADACAAEGMSAGGSTPSALSCCKGLVATNSWQHEHVAQGCNIPSSPGSEGSCVKCGDGKCDSKHFENKCNCPKDCK